MILGKDQIHYYHDENLVAKRVLSGILQNQAIPVLGLVDVGICYPFSLLPVGIFDNILVRLCHWSRWRGHGISTDPKLQIFLNRF